MRINDLLLESEMLLESYRDLARIWEELLQNGDIPAPYRERVFAEFPTKLEALLKNQLARSVMASDEELTRLYGMYGIKNPLDVTSWLAGIKNEVRRGRSYTAMRTFYDIVGVIENKVNEEKELRNPKYKKIGGTSTFIVFDVENFAGARKLRNQVSATWCIGTSKSYFDGYGTSKRRKTIIVFFPKKKEGMVFHVDSNGGGLVTSHDNQREWEVANRKFIKGRGSVSLERELEKYMTTSEWQEMFGIFRMGYPEEKTPEEPLATKRIIDDATSLIKSSRRHQILERLLQDIRQRLTTITNGKDAAMWVRNHIGNNYRILMDSTDLSELEASLHAMITVMSIMDNLGWHMNFFEYDPSVYDRASLHETARQFKKTGDITAMRRSVESKTSAIKSMITYLQDSK